MTEVSQDLGSRDAAAFVKALVARGRIAESNGDAGPLALGRGAAL